MEAAKDGIDGRGGIFRGVEMIPLEQFQRAAPFEVGLPGPHFHKVDLAVAIAAHEDLVVDHGGHQASYISNASRSALWINSSKRHCAESGGLEPGPVSR